jgi:hypothetical protein
LCANTKWKEIDIFKAAAIYQKSTKISENFEFYLFCDHTTMAISCKTYGARWLLASVKYIFQN